MAAARVPQLPLHKKLRSERCTEHYKPLLFLGRAHAPTQMSAAELGSGWATFQTRVLPWLNWTRARSQSASLSTPYRLETRSGALTM